jgi:uncharacterized protein (UPF0332 family)
MRGSIETRALAGKGHRDKAGCDDPPSSRHQANTPCSIRPSVSITNSAPISVSSRLSGVSPESAAFGDFSQSTASSLESSPSRLRRASVRLGMPRAVASSAREILTSLVKVSTAAAEIPWRMINTQSSTDASARLLLDVGDVDGVCNRAYYAMFDAARAALIQSSAPVVPEVAKTHNGLISAFSLHLVKTGRVPTEFGKALNKVAETRLIADYTGDEVTAQTAQWAASSPGYLSRDYAARVCTR